MHNNLHSLIDSFKTMYLLNMKDGGYYENMFILGIIAFATYIINYLTNENSNTNHGINSDKNSNPILENFLSILSSFNIISKKKRLILEGKRCLKVTSFLTKTDNLFSNRFSAFWYYISKNNLINPSITSLKEYANSSNIYDDYGDPVGSKHHKKNYGTNGTSINSISNMGSDIFMVDQLLPFKITNDIYCKVYKSTDRGDDKRKYDMENIIVEIYSYTLSLKNLADFLDNLYFEYCREIDRVRHNKKFIYTLVGTGDGSITGSNDRNCDNETLSVWEECEFKSSRTFNNLFFDDKKRLQDKIDFFINNKEWYDYEGHPYTFGIGLHGPPGTGKTSIIKCIANKLNRHIIVIPLSKIKTQREFSQYFFESYYNSKNSKKIGFTDKIIIFEDIDCMTDIVKKRVTEPNKDNNIDQCPDNNELLNKNAILQNELLNKIAKKVDDDHKDAFIVDFEKHNNDKITLSFILNIIDGIRETPGRILIITSNKYESLDPALIRPGRIDLTLEMRNASVEVIKDMYAHYYNDSIPINIEQNLKDYVISPAKIVNMRLENERKNDFLIALKKEFQKG